MDVIEHLVELVRFKDVMHCFVHHVLEQIFIIPEVSRLRYLALYRGNIIIAGLYTYDLRPFLQSEEQIFTGLRQRGSSLARDGVDFVAVVALPVDRALDFAFEVGW